MQKMNKKFPDFKEGEKEYWEIISPDIRLILEELEKSEDWVYNNEQFPELFAETANFLPTIALIEEEFYVNSIINDLIMILSVMPFRQCVYALSWIETHSRSELGWGIKIFEHSIYNLKIYNSGEVLYDSSHVIRERVQALIKLRVSAQVFSNPMNTTL